MGGKKKKNKLREKDSFKSESDAFSDGKQCLENEDVETGTTNEENFQYADKKVLKRQHVDDGSDSEEIPKKVKKKKKQNLDETSKKNKKSIRQMKREKKAQRQAEAQAVVKDQLKSQCLHYLSQWKNDRQNWKFMKAKQLWLYKNKFSTQLIPETSWPVFLEYFDSAKGNIKKMLLDDASKIIKQMDEWTELHNNDEETKTDEVVKPDDTVYNRARSIIQCLQE